MAKKQTEIPADKLALYDQLVASHAETERKGNTLPYTSHNGHMFTFLSADGTLAIRLAEKERAAFMKQYKAALMLAHGVVMKEYVAVPDSLLKKTKELKPWFELSLAYIKTLKPKPARKK